MASSPDKAALLSRLVQRNERPPIRLNRGNFKFNTISALAVIVFLGAAVGAQMTLGDVPPNEELGMIAGAVLVATALLFAIPYWAMVIVSVGALWALMPFVTDVDLTVFGGIVSLGLIIAPGIEVISQWDKIVVLRLGKFHRVRGPGPLFLFPLLDTIAGYVDTRIRVTDFSAEKSLTRDTVPVHIDALAFWMIWDAHRAVLEVQDFEQAVILSAQTALRATIGANDLSTLLSERERLGQEIQQIVDAKTNPWGITILSVEFKEILIPKELEDALSRQAQASRERKARVILSGTEAEIAESFAQAAETYRDDPTALQLRAMNMIYESIRNKGGLVLVPSDALQGMNLGTVLGAKAYSDRVQPESVEGPGIAELGATEGPEPSGSGSDQDSAPEEASNGSND